MMGKPFSVDDERRASTKGQKRPPQVLTRDEVLRLIGTFSAKSRTGIRMRSAIVIMYRAGLRIAEALSIAEREIDRDAGMLTVLHGKGDKSRTVGIDPMAMSIVSQWIDARRQLASERGWPRDPDRPLICTFAGGTIKQTQIRRALHSAAERAGIEKIVRPHGLRHTMAFELANEGVPMHIIQHQLGHESLATTDRYISHIAPTQVLAAMSNRPAWS